MLDMMQGIHLSRKTVDNLQFGNDICLIETSWEKFQNSTNMVKKDAESTELKINVGKKKTLVISNSHLPGQVKVDDTNIEDVKQFIYLGSLIMNNNDCSSKELAWP